MDAITDRIRPAVAAWLERGEPSFPVGAFAAEIEERHPGVDGLRALVGILHGMPPSLALADALEAAGRECLARAEALDAYRLRRWHD